MNSEKILKEEPYDCRYNTIKDIMVDCLKEEGIISEESIDEIDCELYFKTHFNVYKSYEEFIIETSLPTPLPYLYVVGYEPVSLPLFSL